MFNKKEKSIEEITTEKFHNFQGREKPLDEGKTLCEFFNKKNRVAMFATAIIYLFIPVFWIVVDYIKDSNIVLQKPVSLVGNFLLFGSSLLMLIYQIIFWGKKQYKPLYFYAAYNCLIIVSVALLSIGNNIAVYNEIQSGSMVATGDFSILNFFCTQRGIALSSLCLVSIALAPLPRVGVSIFMGALATVAVILPALPFMPGHQVYSIIQYIVALGCFAFIYAVNFSMELKRCYLERHLELLSFTDEITKSLNRTALETYIDIIKNKGDTQDMGVILFDIDDFKKYNDRYSHPEGDKVLKRVISIVLASIDKSKQLVFRYGGEEFVILLPKSSKQEVVNLANKIHDSVVAANISRDDGALYPYVTITLGCDLTNVGKEFIRKVDEQLYIGKRNNKNCVVFNGEIVSK